MLDLEESIYNKLLILRSIQRLVSNINFQQAYKLATVNQKSIILRLIEEYKKDELGAMVNEIVKQHESVDKYNLKDLRIYAHRLGIPNYYTLNKFALLSEVIKTIKTKQQFEDNLNFEDKINCSPQICSVTKTRDINVKI